MLLIVSVQMILSRGPLCTVNCYKKNSKTVSITRAIVLCTMTCYIVMFIWIQSDLQCTWHRIVQSESNRYIHDPCYPKVTSVILLFHIRRYLGLKSSNSSPLINRLRPMGTCHRLVDNCLPILKAHQVVSQRIHVHVQNGIVQCR